MEQGFGIYCTQCGQAFESGVEAQSCSSCGAARQVVASVADGVGLNVGQSVWDLPRRLSDDGGSTGSSPTLSDQWPGISTRLGGVIQDVRQHVAAGLQVGLLGYVTGLVLVLAGSTLWANVLGIRGAPGTSNLLDDLVVSDHIRLALLYVPMAFGVPLRLNMSGQGGFSEITAWAPLVISLAAWVMWLRARSMRRTLSGWVGALVAAAASGLALAGPVTLLARWAGEVVTPGGDFTVLGGGFAVCFITGFASTLLGVSSGVLPRTIRAAFLSVVVLLTGGVMSHGVIAAVGLPAVFGRLDGGTGLVDMAGIQGLYPLWGLSIGALSSVRVSGLSVVDPTLSSDPSLEVGSSLLPDWASATLPLATLAVALVAAIVLARSAAIRGVGGVLAVAGVWGFVGLAMVEVSTVEVRAVHGAASVVISGGPSSFTPVLFLLWGGLVGLLGWWCGKPRVPRQTAQSRNDRVNPDQ